MPRAALGSQDAQAADCYAICPCPHPKLGVYAPQFFTGGGSALGPFILLDCHQMQICPVGHPSRRGGRDMGFFSHQVTVNPAANLGLKYARSDRDFSTPDFRL